jgi:hypothetical protein
MVERLQRHQSKLNRRAEKDPLTIRLMSSRDVQFPPQCPACNAPAARRVDLEKHARFTVHTHDGSVERQQTVRLSVWFCSDCVERHASQIERSDHATGTSVSRAIEYRVNPRTDSLFGSSELAWHAFRFQSADYAAKFRELNKALLWSPTLETRITAKQRGSDTLQLIVLIAVAAALALWSYLTR